MASKPGRPKEAIYSRVIRITLYPEDTDLLPFFEQLEQLNGNRNAALLAAIRGGAPAASEQLHAESRKAGALIDELLEAF